MIRALLCVVAYLVGGLATLAQTQVARPEAVAVGMPAYAMAWDGGATQTGGAFKARTRALLDEPDLDVIFLVVGGLLLYVEFHLPGTVLPGSLGTLLLLLGGFGLSQLVLRPVAVVVLVLGLALILLEAKAPAHGIAGAAGIVALVGGLAAVVGAPGPHVRPAVAVGAGLLFGAVTLTLARVAARARGAKRLLGAQAMLGHAATALTPLGAEAPGQVEVRGEIWRAVLAQNALDVPAGAAVRVVAVDGLTLTVRT